MVAQNSFSISKFKFLGHPSTKSEVAIAETLHKWKKTIQATWSRVAGSNSSGKIMTQHFETSNVIGHNFSEITSTGDKMEWRMEKTHAVKSLLSMYVLIVNRYAIFVF